MSRRETKVDDIVVRVLGPYDGSRMLLVGPRHTELRIETPEGALALAAALKEHARVWAEAERAARRRSRLDAERRG